MWTWYNDIDSLHQLGGIWIMKYPHREHRPYHIKSIVCYINKAMFELLPNLGLREYRADVRRTVHSKSAGLYLNYQIADPMTCP